MCGKRYLFSSTWNDSQNLSMSSEKIIFDSSISNIVGALLRLNLNIKNNLKNLTCNIKIDERHFSLKFPCNIHHKTKQEPIKPNGLYQMQTLLF